jgi:hypothetical protein
MGLEQSPAKGSNIFNATTFRENYEALKGHQSSHEIANRENFSALLMILRVSYVFVTNVVKVSQQREKIRVFFEDFLPGLFAFGPEKPVFKKWHKFDG